ncbi:MAG: HAD family hydrolase [Patescibacteria group bacterium]
MIKLIIWDLIGVVYQNAHIDEKAKIITNDVSKMGIKNCTISNTIPDLIKEVSKVLGMNPAISTVETGLSKRDRETYEYLLKEAGVLASETLMIDDHKKNLHAAKELGIITVFFGEGWPRELGVDYAIKKLDDLIDILNKLNT